MAASGHGLHHAGGVRPAGLCQPGPGPWHGRLCRRAAVRPADAGDRGGFLLRCFRCGRDADGQGPGHRRARFCRCGLRGPAVRAQVPGAGAAGPGGHAGVLPGGGHHLLRLQDPSAGGGAGLCGAPGADHRGVRVDRGLGLRGGAHVCARRLERPAVQGRPGQRDRHRPQPPGRGGADADRALRHPDGHHRPAVHGPAAGVDQPDGHGHRHCRWRRGGHGAGRPDVHGPPGPVAHGHVGLGHWAVAGCGRAVLRHLRPAGPGGGDGPEPGLSASQRQHRQHGRGAGPGRRVERCAQARRRSQGAGQGRRRAGQAGCGTEGAGSRRRQRSTQGRSGRASPAASRIGRRTGGRPPGSRIGTPAGRTSSRRTSRSRATGCAGSPAPGRRTASGSSADPGGRPCCPCGGP